LLLLSLLKNTGADERGELFPINQSLNGLREGKTSSKLKGGMAATAFLLVALFIFTPGAIAGNLMYGDVDLNGMVDGADAGLVKQCVTGVAQCPGNADATGDDCSIKASDAFALQKNLAFGTVLPIKDPGTAPGCWCVSLSGPGTVTVPVGGSAPVTATLNINVSPPRGGLSAGGVVVDFAIVSQPGDCSLSAPGAVTGADGIAQALLTLGLLKGTITGEASINLLSATGILLNKVSAGFTVVAVDNSPPVITITSPTDGFLTNNPTITVAGTIDDTSITSAILTLNGIDMPIAVSLGSFSEEITLSEGLNTITVRATDINGNTGTSETITVTLDTTAPVVTITNPANGAIFSTSSIIVAGGIDDPFITSAILTLNGVNSAIPVTAGSFNQEVNLVEGPNTISVSATDLAGNTGTSEIININLDSSAQAPIVTITSPTNNSLTGNPAAIVSGTIDDLSITSAILILNWTTEIVIAVDSGLFSQEITLVEGLNTILVRATNSPGNTGMSEIVKVNLDTTPPAVTITSPTDGSFTNNATITVAGTIDDITISSATLTLNGIDTSIPVSAGSFSQEINLVDGSNTILVSATDLAGNTGTSEITTITLDTTAPAVTITSPTDGLLTNNPTITVAGTIDDPLITSAILTLNGIDMPITVSLGSFSQEITLSEGPNTILVSATDLAGNTGTSEAVNVNLDTTPPAVIITSPTDGFLTNNPAITVPGTIDDIAITSAVLTLNGASTNIPVSAGSFSQEITLVEGPNTISISATDAAGNTGSAAISVTLDTTAPIITITSPTDGSLVNTAAIVVTGIVDDTSITSVILTLNGVLVDMAVPVFSGSFSKGITLSGGTNTIIVSATDPAGNTGITEVNVTLLPGITISLFDPEEDINVIQDQFFDFTVNVSCLNIVDCGEINVTLNPPCEGTTISYETPIGTTCSSEYSAAHACSNAIDGNTGSHWLGDGSGLPQWIYFDLGTEKCISGVKADIYGPDVPMTMDIQVSDDASSWTTVVSDWTVPIGDTWQEVTFTEITGRYVRLYEKTSARAYGNCDEFQVLTRAAGAGAKVSTVPGDTPFYTTDSNPITINLNAGESQLVTWSVNATGDVSTSHTFLASADLASNPDIKDITETVSITIKTPPVLDPIGNKAVDENSLLEFTINATDPDGDSLTYSASSLPVGATFVGQTFSWLPSYEQAGVYNVHFEVTDGELTDSEDITITVNDVNRAPTAAITAPDNGEIFLQGCLITFTGTGVDPEDGSLTGAALQWYSDIDGYLGSGESIIILNLSVGYHIITLTATDSGGLSDLNIINISITAITITSPGDGTLTNDPTITVAGTIDDTSITSAILTLNGIDMPIAVSLGSFSQEITLSEGLNTISVRATDINGNTGSSETVTVTLDTTAPIVTVTNPADGAIFSTSSIIVAGGIDDPSITSATLNFNGVDSAIPVTAGSFNREVNLVEGPNTISVRATDLAGNTGTSEIINVNLDSSAQAPVVIVTSPTNNSLTSNPTAIVSGTIDDLSIISATLILNWGTEITIDVDSGLFSQPIALLEGLNTILVTATDLLGNTGTSETVNVTLDTTPPVVIITSPTDGSLTNSATITVAGTIDDLTITSATLTLNGVDTNIPVSAGSFSYEVSLIDGLNNISVSATDAAGNTGSAAISVTLDTTAPIITITSPTDGSLVNTTAIVVMGAIDDPSITSAILTLNGIDTIISVSADSFSQEITLSEGPNTIQVRATDLAGNTGTSEIITVTLDTTAPIITITNPADGSIVYMSNITVDGTIDDLSITSAILTLNGADINIAVSSGAFSQGVNLVEGPNTISVSATDAAGNTGTAEVICTLALPMITITSPTDGSTLPNVFTVEGIFNNFPDSSQLEVIVNGLTASVITTGSHSGSFTVILGEGGGLASFTFSGSNNSLIQGNPASKTVDVDVTFLDKLFINWDLWTSVEGKKVYGKIFINGVLEAQETTTENGETVPRKCFPASFTTIADVSALTGVIPVTIEVGQSGGGQAREGINERFEVFGDGFLAPGIADGPLTVVATASDGLNTASDSINVTINTTPPSPPPGMVTDMAYIPGGFFIMGSDACGDTPIR
jgi:hypothetical protein